MTQGLLPFKYESDEGFCRILRRIEQHGVYRRERRELERRWHKEKKRVKGKAFIPLPNRHLKGFACVNKDLLSFVQRNKEQREASVSTILRQRVTQPIHL